MTDTLFKIMFEGQVRDGVEPDTAKANVAGLFKSDAAAVEKLFSGTPVTLKRGLVHTEAERYIAALKNAGVEARIEPDLAISLTLDEVTTPANAWAADTPAPQTASPYAPPKAQVGSEEYGHSTLKVFTTHGRIDRLRFLAWSMVQCVTLIVLLSVALTVMNASLVGGGLLIAVLVIAFITIGVMIGVQRLHDLGWSGWLLLLNLVPFVGTLFPFLIMVLPGTQGPNQYGPPPPPNTRGVKFLAVVWIAMIPVITVASIYFGIANLAKEELALKTDEYEQTLAYDDQEDTDSALTAPDDVNEESNDQNDK
ncbi:DUF805 domain-containing protein [Pseudomonas cannabina]|uniref:DUF805 domain-containing protein n=1 Tax=Pseudomonas cannabina TaxID=86840 RepID=A0A0P9QW37_PSECA|nr:DUF805 domain-containing protein [Pseudomonas cannabina]KAA8712453.1 DUF805 domain-containing protein [Pseudomonas cannabina]KPW75163.1 Uncharacterized protein ALO81_04573 [Pseudomonas cannabina]RMN21359.1 hypothetical protein ALQ64_04154 [Pseudomonas cannabina]SDR32532.1 Uncharacterized membrane protein YhaH, DUF805 family [Pseudomonas cannabina]